MGRKPKIYPSQIEDFLNENGGAIPIKKIAKAFDVTVPTIRKNLKTLRKQGVKVIPTPKGIYLCGQITEADSAALIAKFGIWLVASMLGLATLADVGKKPLQEAKRLLLGSLTKEEQKKFRAITVMFKNAVDLLEIEEEFTKPSFQLEIRH